MGGRLLTRSQTKRKKDVHNCGKSTSVFSPLNSVFSRLLLEVKLYIKVNTFDLKYNSCAYKSFHDDIGNLPHQRSFHSKRGVD